MSDLLSFEAPGKVERGLADIISPTEEIIEEAAGMMDMNLDHPFAWNGMPPELLKEAKLLWKLS